MFGGWPGVDVGKTQLIKPAPAVPVAPKGGSFAWLKENAEQMDSPIRASVDPELHNETLPTTGERSVSPPSLPKTAVAKTLLQDKVPKFNAESKVVPKIKGSVGPVGDTQHPAVTAEQLAQQLAQKVGRPAPVSKNPKARRKSEIARAVGEMKGILQIGPKTPNRDYITQRCKMLPGLAPLHAITLQYLDKDGKPANYNKGDLVYDLKCKYLTLVDTANVVNEDGDEYDFACLADVKEYFQKESKLSPNGAFKSLNEDIVEMAMWATEEHQCLYNISFEEMEEQLNDCLIALGSGGDPLTREDAQLRPEWPMWEKAEIEELESMDRLKVFDWVPRSKVLEQGKKIIRSKWVYKYKEVEMRYKCRLCAKGFMQSPFEYGETYAPVCRLSTVRTLLSYATSHGNNWGFRGLDISTAFINATLKDSVYMEPPEGYQHPDGKGMVWELKKAIYGLKQSPRDWYDTLIEWMMDPNPANNTGFKQSDNDPCLFYRKVGDKILWCCIYVDDMLMAGDQELITNFMSTIEVKYKIRDLGEPKTFLGMEINRGKDGKSLLLTCERYIQNVAEKFKCLSTGTCKVLMTEKLTPGDQSDKASEVDPTYYRSMVGSILYASITCRPDIAYTVKELSRFLVKPTQAHLAAARRCIMYLHETKDKGLLYSSHGENSNQFSLYQKRVWSSKPVNKPLGYSDADWAGEVPGRKSTSGYVFMLNGAAISWSSRTQSVVALSTTEAEYYALCEATKEALHVQKMLAELKQVSAEETVLIFEDNQACAQWSKMDGLDHNRTKHIDIRYHMIRDNVKKQKVHIDYIPTQEMVADIMTKPLGFDLHHRATLKMMGYVDIISKPGQKLSGALTRGDDPEDDIQGDTNTQNNGIDVQNNKTVRCAPAAAFAQAQDAI